MANFHVVGVPAELQLSASVAVPTTGFRLKCVANTSNTIVLLKGFWDIRNLSANTVAYRLGTGAPNPAATDNTTAAKIETLLLKDSEVASLRPAMANNSNQAVTLLATSDSEVEFRPNQVAQ